MSAEIQTVVTAVLAVDPARPDPVTLARAAAVLQRGGLVAFPTETVYGLGANALDAEAVARIFAAKARPAEDPVIIHVADMGALEQVTAGLSPLARALAARFWPGPLTLVLPKASIVPEIVTAGGPTVAVRWPAHPLAQALIRAAERPIAAPSANRFSHTSPTSARHVWDDLAGRVDLILDGGPTPIGVESTVLDLRDDRPVILRPGGVTAEALTAALAEWGATLAPGQGRENGRVHASPGMMARHYAPNAALWLFTGADAAIHAAFADAVRRAMEEGRTVALMVADEDLPRCAGLGAPMRSIGSLTQLDQAAHHLFRVMRELDETGAELIFARDFPVAGLGLAIRDRLRRAAARVVIADVSAVSD